jgi:hypothetical protein
VRYVVLSSDRNADYVFPLPITASLWARKIGRRPLVVLVGSPSDWEGDAVALAAWRAVERMAGPHLTLHVPAAEGYRTGTTAQMARLWAAQWPDLHETSTLLTADADMWPLSRSYFDREVKANHLLLYGGDAYSHEKEFKVPICYVEADVGTWRDVFGAKEGLGVAGAVQAALDGGIDREAHRLQEAGAGQPLIDAARFREWCFDEVLAGRHIQAWTALGGRSLIIQRRPSFWKNGSPGAAVHGRIDRSDWRFPLPPERHATNGDFGYIDAHMDRPGWTDRNWGRYRELLAWACPELVEAADEYRKEFCEAMDRR